MKTKILLFALLCGALNAADSRYATGLAKPSPSKDFVSGFESGVRYGLIAHIDRPDEDDIPTFTDNAKKLYFQIVADEGKTFTADLMAAGSDTTIAVLCESGLRITTQEAADVVKAMEILDSASRPRSESMGFMSSYSNDLVYRPNGFSAGERAAMAREEAAFYEAKAKAEAEQYERVKWARSILELWKKKSEGAK